MPGSGCWTATNRVTAASWASRDRRPTARSGDLEGGPGQAAPVAVDLWSHFRLRIGGGAQGDEERDEVLDGGVGIRQAGCGRSVRGELVHVTAGEGVVGPGMEVGRP